MNCPQCAAPLKVIRKRKRASGPGSCLFELIGVLLIVFTFPTVIGPIVGFLFLLLGHFAAYKTVELGRCRDCGNEYPVG